MAKAKKTKQEKETAELKETLKVGKGKIEISKGTLKIDGERDIAYDFATKIYAQFGKIIKSIVLFGSTAKQTAAEKSDIDIIIIIDDCTIQWDAELVAWYREELGKLIQVNPYKKSLHINTVRLRTWWNEMMRGDPLIVNIIRYGEALIDFGGFFNPLKVLLEEGKITNTPETVYITLSRVPAHMARSKANMINAIEGLYWAMVDAAHSALMAAKQVPPSPEHIPEMLSQEFVSKKMINSKLVKWYEDLYTLAHKYFRGELTDVKGKDIDEWETRTDEFVKEMATLTDKLTGLKK